MTLARLRRRPLIVPVLLAATLTLAGCSASDEVDLARAPTSSSSSPSTPSPSEPESPTAEPTGSATSETPDPEASPELAAAPEARLDGGVVGEGSPVTVQGEGPTTVTFGRALVKVVATLDCTGCSGAVVLTGPGRMSSFGQGTAPWSGTVLVDFVSNAGDEVYVEASGPWTLTLTSLFDIPPTQGATSGAGHTVLVRQDSATSWDFWCRPAPGESCSSQAYSLTGSDVIGGSTLDVEGTDTVEVVLPGVIGIRTNGEWSVTP